MKVAKWGNSLAVRLPKDVVEALGLKENDEVNLVPASADNRTLTVVADSEQSRREAAVERLRKYRGWIPAGFKFDRDEANER
jgi:antitoxin MazE